MSKKNSLIKFVVPSFLSILGILLIVLGIYINSNKNNVENKDFSAPILVFASLESNNEVNKYFAEDGNKIILTFSFNEELDKNPLVKINDTDVEVQYNNGTYSAVYLVKEQYDSDKDITFKIFNYKDTSNNIGEAITKTTDNSKITIKAKNSQVEIIPVESISFDKSFSTIYIGEEKELIPTINPYNANYDSILWKSSDNSVATVSNGKVTGIKAGTATITATIGDKSTSTSIKVEKKTIPVSKITLNSSNISLVVGNSTTLKATISPNDSSDKNITWKSSDNSVATVSNGKVTGIKTGTATITASAGGKSVSATVNVNDKEIPVSNISLNTSNKSIYVGDSITLNATVSPTNATYGTINWKSSNTSVATVSDGKVIGINPGTCTITATAGGKSVSATITVKYKVIDVSNITLNTSTSSIYVGDSITLNATVSPSNATNKTVSWSSSNTSVATVSDGKVIGLKAGTAIITATAGDKIVSATVTVRNMSVSSISITPSSASISVLDSINLNATISPSNATDKTVTWSSSDRDVAIVNNGKVTGLKAGTCTITATAGGKSASATITVKKAIVPVSSIILFSNYSSVYVGDSITITAIVKPSNATDPTVTWTSSDNSIATVSNGVVTGIKAGTVTITARAGDESISKTVTVNNTPVVNVSSVSLNKTSETIYMNANSLSTTLTATVSPSNATNKTVSWSSSNTSVATVSNGIVTAVSPGTTTITATAGGKSTSATVTVKKKVIIVIGASQVDRMDDYTDTYSSANNNYSQNNGTLNYIYKSGSGMEYQTGDGWTAAQQIITSYRGNKNYIEFNVFFPLSGNSIKSFTCSKITTSNSTIIGYASNYNSVISSIKSNGYSVNAYVVSMHPVKVSQSSSDNVVTNQDSDACSSGYRSNRKYHTFNQTIKSIINSSYSSNLKYEELFTKIMLVNDTGKNYSYLITYDTTDGIHWNNATTVTYVNMMFDNAGSL